MPRPVSCIAYGATRRERLWKNSELPFSLRLVQPAEFLFVKITTNKISLNQNLFRASAGLEHGFVNDPELVEGLIDESRPRTRINFPLEKVYVSEKVLVRKRFILAKK